MNIERVRLTSALKCGGKTFGVGMYFKPIPPEIIEEIRAGSSSIQVLEGSYQPPLKQPEQIEKEVYEEQIASLKAEIVSLKAEIVSLKAETDKLTAIIPPASEVDVKIKNKKGILKRR